MLGTVWPSSLLAQRAVADDPRWTRAVEDNPTIPSEGCPKSEGCTRSFGGGESRGGRGGVKGFRRLFMLYGLVASILAVMSVVGLLTYRMGESPWRWPLLAVIVAGFGTIAGIFWIRRYIDRQTKASEQGSKQ
jgi:hypothetical protein